MTGWCWLQLWADGVRHRRGVAPPSGEWGICCSCGRAAPGAMLLIVERTLSAIAAGRASHRGLVVSAAFVGGSPRRDAFDC